MLQFFSHGRPRIEEPRKQQTFRRQRRTSPEEWRNAWTHQLRESVSNERIVAARAMTATARGRGVETCQVAAAWPRDDRRRRGGVSRAANWVSGQLPPLTTRARAGGREGGRSHDCSRYHHNGGVVKDKDAAAPQSRRRASGFLAGPRTTAGTQGRLPRRRRRLSSQPAAL